MGGGTLLDACLVVEEFFGAVANIEGRVALLELFSASLPPSSFIEVALSGVGAFADMGGKALPDAGLVMEEFFGGVADIEGRVVLLKLFSASLPPSSFVEVALSGALPGSDLVVEEFFGAVAKMCSCSLCLRVGVFPLVSRPNDLHVRRKAINWRELTSAFVILTTSVIGVGVTWTSVVGTLPNKALAANVLLLVARLMARL